MTRVVDRIEQVEGYIPGETPVEFLGDIQRSQLAMTRPAFAHLGSLTGTEENYAITYGDTFWMYLEDVMGYPIKRFRETKNEEQERVTMICHASRIRIRCRWWTAWFCEADGTMRRQVAR